jgi:hypothetical protein
LPVDRSYADKSPFPFTGRITKVVFDVKPHLAAEERGVREAHHQSLVAHGLSG